MCTLACRFDDGVATLASKVVIFIHVNPPSFVRSLRHFGIAENLRPRDENLRRLTAISRFKKLRIFLAINSENVTYFAQHSVLRLAR